jgi:hypothetical protein
MRETPRKKETVQQNCTLLIVGLKKERKERGGEKGEDMTECRLDEWRNREKMKGRWWVSRRPNKGSRWEREEV